MPAITRSKRRRSNTDEDDSDADYIPSPSQEDSETKPSRAGRRKRQCCNGMKLSKAGNPIIYGKRDSLLENIEDGLICRGQSCYTLVRITSDLTIHIDCYLDDNCNIVGCADSSTHQNTGLINEVVQKWIPTFKAYNNCPEGQWRCSTGSKSRRNIYENLHFLYRHKNHPCITTAIKLPYIQSQKQNLEDWEPLLSAQQDQEYVRQAIVAFDQAVASDNDEEEEELESGSVCKEDDTIGPDVQLLQHYKILEDLPPSDFQIECERQRNALQFEDSPVHLIDDTKHVSEEYQSKNVLSYEDLYNSMYPQNDEEEDEDIVIEDDEEEEEDQENIDPQLKHIIEYDVQAYEADPPLPDTLNSLDCETAFLESVVQ